MNRKGTAPAVVWALLILAGILLANYSGLFAVFTPPNTPAPLLSFVNKWYYDPAVPETSSWECVEQSTVLFRTASTTFASSFPIAINEGDNSLVRYSFSASFNTAGLGASGSCDNLGQPVYYGNLLINLSEKGWSLDWSNCPNNIASLRRLSNDEVAVCGYCSSTGRYAYRKYTKGTSGGAISTSVSPENPSNEIVSYTPIKDSGRFTCENGKVVKKFCLYKGNKIFPSIIQDDCSPSLPCIFIRGQNVSGEIRDIVKCSGDYKPNIKVCSSDGKRIHTTDSNGNLITTLCGTNGYNVCSNNACVECKAGTSWCVGNTPTSCINGVITPGTPCPGISTCKVNGTSPDTTAFCSSDFNSSSERCDGNTPQVFSTVIQNWQNKYSFGSCLTSCVMSNGRAVCNNLCSPNTIYCEGAIATLYRCNVSERGNHKVFYNGNALNSQCISLACANPNACASSYAPGREYCFGNQRQIAQESQDPLTGGYIAVNLSVPLCRIGCLVNNVTYKSYCIPIPACQGKPNQNVCKDHFTVGTCNSASDDFTSTIFCPDSLRNEKAFCDGTSTQAVCKVPQAECSGSWGCSVSDNKIFSCTSSGYFNKNDVIENCANLGCYLENNDLPSPFNSQCRNAGGCTGEGYVCSNGVLNDCIIRNGVKDKDSTQYIKGNLNIRCTKGSCQSNSSCEPITRLGTFCESNLLKQAYEDITNLADGKVSIKTLANCNAGCEVKSVNPPLASCKPVRPVGTFCVGSELWRSETDTTRPEYGNTIQTKITDCTYGCETLSANSSICKGPRNRAGRFCGGTSGKELLEAIEDPSFIATGGYRIIKVADCSVSCEENTTLNSARCVEQCRGTTECVGGVIYSCINGALTSPLFTCAELKCQENSNNEATCTDLCSLSELYQCINGNSYKCVENATTKQKVRVLEKVCGTEGCANGFCLSTNKPNSYVCVGEALHSTDANGFKSAQPIKICSQEAPRNGLTPYCSEGYPDCKVCEQNKYICTNNELFQCGNSFTGQKTNVQFCEAGCKSINGQYKCDQLRVSISQNQNFLSNEDVIITGILTGSASGQGIRANYVAKISGPGASDEKIGSTDINGKLAINFGRKPLGSYTVNISFNDYPTRNQVINVKVTNDYRVRLKGDQVITKIPGASPSILIESLDANGEKPDSVVVTSAPLNITASTREESIKGLWSLVVLGPPGTYQIGLSAVKDGVTLSEEKVSVEIRKPQLEIQTNLPSSIKVGKRSFDITVKGPTAQKVTDGISPSRIKATISHSPAVELNLRNLGGGLFTFEYNFAEEGTYTLNVEAEKDDYEPAILSKVVQVSSSGNVQAPPGSDPTSSTQTSPTSSAPVQTDLLSSGNNTFFIIILVLIVFYFLLLNKKGR